MQLILTTQSSNKFKRREKKYFKMLFKIFAGFSTNQQIHTKINELELMKNKLKCGFCSLDLNL